jgi:hypothetical protein
MQASNYLLRVTQVQLPKLDGIDMRDDPGSRNCPTIRENRDDTSVEIQMKPQSALIVAKSIGEQREGELQLTGAVAAPREICSRIAMKVEARVEPRSISAIGNYKTFANLNLAVLVSGIIALSHSQTPLQTKLSAGDARSEL